MSASSQDVSLPLAMTTSTYVPVTTQLNNKSWEQNMKVTSRSTTSFTINTYTTLNEKVSWHVMGI